jgi:hypothetical protein
VDCSPDLDAASLALLLTGKRITTREVPQ